VDDAQAIPPPSLAARLALAAITLAALGLRARDALRGVSPEEAGDLRHGSAWKLWIDSEVGVNPPLLKWIVNLPFECWDSLWFGRALSVIAGTAAVALTFFVARRVARGSDTAGLVAAGLLAVHADAIRNSAEFRPYGVWQAVGALHLLALFHLLDDRASVRARRAVIATAVLLPQLHYFGLPWTLALAAVLALSADTRALARLYVPAFVLVSPLLAVSLASPGLRRPDGHAVLHTILGVTSMELPSPAALAAPVIDSFGISRGEFYMVEHGLFALALAALLLPYAMAERRLTTPERLVLAGAGSVLFSVLTLGQLHLVRSPIVMMTLTSMPAALAAAPFALAKGPGRDAMRVATAAVLATGLIAFWTRAPEVDRSRWPDTFLRTWHQHDAVRAGRDVILYPKATEMLLYLTASHHAWDQVDGQSRCADGTDHCFDWDGARFVVMPKWTGAVPNGLLVAFSPTPKGFGEGCTVVQEDAPRVWDCGPTAP
jgi:hypothetical protein